MSEESNSPLVGADAVALESVIVGVLSPFIFMNSSGTHVFWIFQAAWTGLGLFILLRLMAGRAENPNRRAIQRTLRWSSELFQLTLIGAFTTVTVYANSIVSGLNRPTIFVLSVFITYIAFAIVDLLFLGEFVDTWTEVIEKQAGDNPVGWLLRSAAKSAKSEIDVSMNNKDSTDSKSYLNMITWLTALLTVFVILAIPIWIVYSWLFDGNILGIAVLLSIFALRDIPRYLYLNYGAAETFGQISWGLKMEFALLIIKGTILAITFGYQLPML